MTAILLLGLAGAGAADSLDVVDSLSRDASPFPLWQDTLLAADSAAVSASNRWLFPAGLMALTGAAVYLLYAVRSK